MNAQILNFPSEKPTRKEMVRFFTRAISKIAGIKLVNIEVQPRCMFSADSFRFQIVVFGKGNTANTTFYFYDFWNKERITTDLDKAIRAIKTDDFSIIKCTTIKLNDCGS